MRDVAAELKELRLHGMAGAWTDLVAQGTLASLESSRWLIEHLLEVERGERAMRSVSYQMAVLRNGTAISQIGFIPAQGVAMAPGAFAALADRALLRLQRMPEP